MPPTFRPGRRHARVRVDRDRVARSGGDWFPRAIDRTVAFWRVAYSATIGATLVGLAILGDRVGHAAPEISRRRRRPATRARRLHVFAVVRSARFPSPNGRCSTCTGTAICSVRCFRQSCSWPQSVCTSSSYLRSRPSSRDAPHHSVPVPRRFVSDSRASRHVERSAGAIVYSAPADPPTAWIFPNTYRAFALPLVQTFRRVVVGLPRGAVDPDEPRDPDAARALLRRAGFDHGYLVSRPGAGHAAAADRLPDAARRYGRLREPDPAALGRPLAVAFRAHPHGARRVCPAP